MSMSHLLLRPNGKRKKQICTKRDVKYSTNICEEMEKEMYDKIKLSMIIKI